MNFWCPKKYSQCVFTRARTEMKSQYRFSVCSNGFWLIWHKYQKACTKMVCFVHRVFCIVAALDCCLKKVLPSIGLIPAGIAQSVERRTLGREVGSSNLPAILVVILGKSLQRYTSPYQGVKIVPGKCGEGMNSSGPEWDVVKTCLITLR